MKIARINELAGFLANLPDAEFDMTTWGHAGFKPLHNCGTPACIGGWAAALFEPNTFFPTRDVNAYLAPILGLTLEQAQDLFTPNEGGWTSHPRGPGGTLPKGTNQSDLTRTMAVAVLRNLARTHRVDWSVA
jgi:hypothetical protein